jgi:peptidyl-prolyl cis-trans isomerase A (cyclophilin A)
MSLLSAPARTVRHAIVAAAFVALGVSCKSDGSAGGSASALTKPDKNAISTPAPDSFKVVVETSKGPFTILAHRAWAPIGVDRFYHLVQLGFFDDTRFFRVLPGFMAQFGISGDPRVNTAWESLTIQDDSVKQSNKRGMVTFAKTGMPNSRSTQLFINYANNANLDAISFAPIGEVVDGMTVVDSLYGGYGEGAPDGNGPDQTRMTAEGNAYLAKNFPKLDFIRSARIAP